MKIANYKFSDEMKKHIYFSKIREDTWLVQSDPHSRCQAYFVTVLPYAIVMYGDYDGVIVKPHECGNENLICWMAGATTLSYFAEKVHHGDQYHQTKIFDADTACASLMDKLVSYFEIYDMKEYLMKELKGSNTKYCKWDSIDCEFAEKLALNLGCHVDNVEDTYERETKNKYSEMTNAIETLMRESFHWEGDFYEFTKDNEWCGSDWERDDYMTYHHQIKWQHECLLWWANHVLENKDKENHIPTRDKVVETIKAKYIDIPKMLHESNGDGTSSDLVIDEIALMAIRLENNKNE